MADVRQWRNRLRRFRPTPDIALSGFSDAYSGCLLMPQTAKNALPVSVDGTLRDYLGDLDPHTMVHLTDSAQEAFASGIDPGTFFARFGDVSHLTPQEFRVGVVGPIAAGHGPNATRFVTVSARASEEFFTPWESAFGYVEWQNPYRVMPDQFFTVPPGPSFPYPAIDIPPPLPPKGHSR